MAANKIVLAGLLDRLGRLRAIRLILASSSPARRELLARLGLAFEVLPAHIDEPTGLVHFTALDDEEMSHYLQTREWQNNSGAYAIREDGDPYVRVEEGVVTNVIGLPLETLQRRLEWIMQRE
jgi:predicted house-cleaning NTP pyrophosphatase (Maf/HAM1 superfamily)